MDNLDAFTIFAAVGELESVSAAARALGLPKANVSRSVLRLELAYKVQLLERTTRRVTLTEAGRIFHVRCLRMREEMAEASAQIAAFRGEPEGSLRIGCSGDVARTILTPHLHEFLDQYPNINVRVQVGERLLPEANSLDVVLHCGWLSDSRLSARKISEVRTLLVASRGYVAQHGLPESPEEMAGRSVIGSFYLDPSAADTGPLPAQVPMLEIARAGKRYCLPSWPRFASTDHSQALELVMHGRVIAPIAAIYARPGLISGDLVRVLPSFEIYNPPSFYALFTQRAALIPKLRVFLEFVAQITEREVAGLDVIYP